MHHVTLTPSGVTMSQIGARRSAIGEESEPCTSDEDARASSTWRDSGIDTISSTYTSINASLSDEETDEFKVSKLMDGQMDT